MAKTAKRSKGDIGEEVTCKYLEKKGYEVVERNYLRPWGEIDILAKKANLLSFIEVKSVSCEISQIGKGNMRPEDNLHPAKLKKLHRAIQTYLLDHKVPQSLDWQVDLACVYLDFSAKRARVELLENVIL